MSVVELTSYNQQAQFVSEFSYSRVSRRETLISCSMVKGVEMQELNNYDPIASYDRHWTDRYQPLVLELLSDLLLKDLAPGSSILDVGCGTGVITGNLVSQGYRAFGIDISPEMVKCAQKRFPDGKFEIADIRSYRIERRFDAAISLFDT